MRVECMFNFYDGERESIIFKGDINEDQLLRVKIGIQEGCRDKEFVYLDNGVKEIGVDCSKIRSYSIARWKPNET